MDLYPLGMDNLAVVLAHHLHWVQLSQQDVQPPVVPLVTHREGVWLIWLDDLFESLISTVNLKLVLVLMLLDESHITRAGPEPGFPFHSLLLASCRCNEQQ